MGFMNVLKFSAACFDLLSWPLIALGYPLCASIWVIETNSISDIRKLVTYWILFSLISLFDHAFSKLLECIPFWSYIKMMVICWLVIPHFDGSYYVYQHLVHPCLSMDPQVVMNRLFNESKKLFHRRENFLVAADRYIKENGAEPLEKLLASKLKSPKPNAEVKEIKAPATLEKKGEQWKCEEPNVAQKDIQVDEVTEIKNGDAAKRCEGPNAAKEIKVTEVTQRTFGGTAQWVKQTEINLGETRSNTTWAAEIKERSTAQVAAEIEACRDDRTPEIPLDKKVQKEWACAVCQVTTQSEATLNSHLQGKRHKATSEQLKAKNQATKTNGSPSALMAKKSDQSTKEEQPKCASLWVEQTEINLGETGINTTCAAETKERATALVAAEIEACRDDRTPEIPLDKKVQKVWACAVCQLTTQSEATLNSHLQGKRHKATSEQLKARSQATKTNGSPSASMTKKSDQSTKEEQPKCTSNNLKSKNNEISAASTVKKPEETKDDEQQKCASSNGLNQKNNKKQEEKVLVSETNEQGHQKNSKQSGSGMKELGLWCNICDVSCTSEVNMASHLNGRRHLNRIKQLSELWCSNCNVKCNSKAEMASHRNEGRHLEQLKERTGLWCSICSVNCNSEVDMDSHLNGRRHLDQIKEQLRLWCGACNVICNSEVNMASHLNGKRHLEKRNI